MKTLEMVFEMVNDWGSETFPHATHETCMAHLRRELVELGDALQIEGAMEFQSTRAEIADCFILFAQVLGRMGVDWNEVSIVDEVIKKMAINRARVWGEPDAEGVVEHVRYAGTDTVLDVQLVGIEVNDQPVCLGCGSVGIEGGICQKCGASDGDE